jgi:ParB family chromosome partitioning protein
VSSKADKLGVGASFGRAPVISARRAAIAAVTDAPTDGVSKQEFRLDLISFNPDNPREELKGIQEMADTLAAVGQITAITLATVGAYLKDRPHRAHALKRGAQYVMVDGHRRLAGAEALEWETIRAIVDDAQVATDERLLEAAFIANTQRDDMTELEQAEALRKLVAFHGSQSKTAKRLGMSQAVISQRLSLLALSPELQADLNTGTRKIEHVRNLAGLPPEQQKAKADERAAASKTRTKTKQPARSAATEPRTPGPAEHTYYAVIAPHQDEPTAPASTDTAPIAVPSQSASTQSPPSPHPRHEPEWAVEDTSDPVNTARYLAERFTHHERRVIVSYLLSVGDAEAKMERRQADGTES